MFQKISIKLAMAQTAMILFVLVIVGMLSYFIMQDQLLRLQKEKLESNATFLSKVFVNYLDNKKHLVAKIATDPIIEIYQKTYSEEALREFLTKFTNDFSRLSYLNKEGDEELTVIKKESVATLSEREMELGMKPIYSAIQKSPNQVLLTSPRKSPQLNAPIMEFGYHPVNFFEESFGFIIAALQLSEFSTLLKDTPLGRSESATIIDSNGRIIYSPQSSHLNTFLKTNQNTSRKFLEKLSAEESLFGEYRLLNIDSLVAVETLPQYNWKVIVALPKTEFLHPLVDLRNTFGIVALLIFLGSLVIIYFLARTIVRPILLLNETILSISQQNDLSQRVDVISTDETGQLARLFNQMLEEVENAQQDIEVAKSSLDNIVKSMTDMLLVLNSDATIQSINPAISHILGYKEESLIGKNITKLLKDTRLKGKVKISDLIEYGFTKGNIETRYLKKNGDVLAISFSGALLYSENEQIQGMVCVASDITERKKAQQALKEQKEWLQVTLSSIGDAIITADEMGKITFMNPVAEEITGWQLFEAKGRKVMAVFHVINEKVLEIIENPVHAILVAKDGRKIPIEENKAPIRGQNGRVIGTVLVFRDITNRRKTEVELFNAKEKAESATKAKSEFLATMSHEIRTPMNGVIGMTGLLFNTELSSQQKEYLEVVRVSSHHLSNVINDILDFSKIESGQFELEEKSFELRDIIEDVGILFAPKAQEKKIEILTFLDPKHPPFLTGDATRIRQVLTNLVDNAVKFTGSGEICISVNKLSQNNDLVELQFSVRDTGIGIPADKIDHIFEAFSQADSSTTRKHGGSGLGLAICFKLVELMGGKLWAKSTIDLGSTFFFTLSLAVAPTEFRPYLKNHIDELENKSVLIVDNNATSLHILGLQCQGWGMLPRKVASPIEAIKLIKTSNSFDLVLLDMNIPEVDRLEFARITRKLHSKKELPIVLLSYLAEDSQSQDSHPFISACVNRPIRQNKLFETLVQICSNKILEEDLPPNPPPIISRQVLAQQLPLRILVAEDNPINQTVALSLLKELGYQADIAVNGVKVFETLKNQSYDIIFMDMQMPEMDGLEATRQIVKNWAVDQRPTIIAMTANAIEGDREKCLEAGMSDYLSKPVSSEDIERLLTQWGKKIDYRAPTLEQKPVSEPLEQKPVSELLEQKPVSEPLEQKVISKLKPSLLKKLAGMFFIQAPDLIKKINQSIEQKDMKKLAEYAHNFKGSCSVIGAKQLCALCNILQEKGHNQDLSDIEPFIQKLAQSYGETRLALEKLI